MTKALSLEKMRIFSGSTLKLLAIILMFIDHFAVVLGGVLPFLRVALFSFGGKSITIYFIMRKLGRLAFPIFCFLITEGFFHTRSKVKYALRLCIFAVISEIPFDLMVGGKLLYWGKQNIYFTLLFGVVLLYAYENIPNIIYKALCMAAVAAVSVVLKVDYSLRGVLLILLLYILREKPVEKTLLAYPLLSGGVPALAAFVPINMYNGQRGFIRSRILQYGFYVFYPLHITLLVLVKILLKQA